MGQLDASETATVVVIDDDENVREALVGLFHSVGLATETYSSVKAFVANDLADRGSYCIVLDIRLPGQSGLEFQEALARDGDLRSVVLISAHVDVQMAVRAMKAGAVDVLTKPVREQDLLDAVNRGIERERARRLSVTRSEDIGARYQTLSDREREIMNRVASGMLNKQIAAEFDLSEATIKLHRSHVMQKMHASSLAELVRFADEVSRLKA